MKLCLTVTGICLMVTLLVSPLLAKAPAVNIYKTTMKEYVASASSNVDQLDYSFAFVDALTVEAEKLSKELDFRFRGSVRIQEHVKAARQATKEFVEKMGTLTEAVCWYDFETHEQFEGTACGYKLLSFQAEMLWREIVFYLTVQKSDDCYEFHGMHKNRVSDKIGGMSPEEIMTAVRIKNEQAKLKNKSVSNLNKMAATNLDKDFVNTFKELQSAILAADASAVANFVRFPMENSAYVVEPDNYTGALTREKFISGFTNLFTDYGRLEISKQSLKDVGVYDDHYCLWFKMFADCEFEAPVVYVKIEKKNNKWLITSFAIAG